MPYFQSKYGLLPGTSFEEVVKLARHEYHLIQKRTPRRQAYVRSNYFKSGKVFINQFWQHLLQKHSGDQLRRVKTFSCAIDLIRYTTLAPETILDQRNSNIELYRFSGLTKDGSVFCVQIRQNSRTGRKDFMSAFPTKKGK
jgi:hypothetical protein